jgi:ankyrin
MQAATARNIAAVMLLIEAGADLTARDQSSLTALHYATWQGDAGTVRLLLAEGANPNTITDTLHETPLHYAASDPEMVKALLDAGIAADAQNYNGWTALYRAVQVGSVESVRTLLAGYARPDVADHAGVTPLMVAAEKGHVEIARLLLEHGASKTAVDDNEHAAEYYLSHEQAMPGLQPKIKFDITDYQTPRNSVIHRPVDPAVIAALRANHEAIRKLLEAD